MLPFDEWTAAAADVFCPDCGYEEPADGLPDLRLRIRVGPCSGSMDGMPHRCHLLYGIAIARQAHLMNEIDVRTIDLNLLKTFIAIFEENSVTEAGERLGLAQSSVSHSLGRLRETVGDPLFVRTTAGMKPTALAQQLHRPISQALAALQEALHQSGRFEPESSVRTFKIIVTDVGELTFIPRLRRHLEAVAPGIGLCSLQMPRNAYREALEEGTADLAIGQLPIAHTEFRQQHLFDESFACFVRQGHHLTEGITLEKFLACEHLIVGPPALAEMHIRKALGHRHHLRRVSLQIRSYLAAPFIVEQTNLVALLPRTVSAYAARMGSIVELPSPVPVEPIQMRQFWHERSHDDVGSRWLRAQIAMLYQTRGNAAP